MERENKKEQRKSKEKRKEKRVLKSGAKMREILERKSE